MEPGNDLIARLDAVMARHRRRPVPEPEIPILTEVVPDTEPILVEPRVEQDAAQAQPAEPLPPALSDEQAKALAGDILQRALQYLDQRFAAEIGQRLEEQLSALIRDALASVLADLRQQIAHSIGEAVSGALQAWLDARTNAPGPPDSTADPI